MKEDKLINRIRLSAPTKIIKVVDSFLDFIGRYILSPIIVIAASSTLIVVLGLLILAHFVFHYQLGGSEIIIGIVIGYVLGLISLYISKLFT